MRRLIASRYWNFIITIHTNDTFIIIFCSNVNDLCTLQTCIARLILKSTNIFTVPFPHIDAQQMLQKRLMKIRLVSDIKEVL